MAFFQRYGVYEELRIVLHEKVLCCGVALFRFEEYLVVEVSRFLHQEVLGYGIGAGSLFHPEIFCGLDNNNWRNFST